MVLRVCRIGLPHRGPRPELAPTSSSDGPSTLSLSALRGLDICSSCGCTPKSWTGDASADGAKCQLCEAECPRSHEESPCQVHVEGEHSLREGSDLIPRCFC